MTTMTENWLPVEGFEGLYEVSDLGRVRSLDHVTIDTIGRTKHFKGQLLRPKLSGGKKYQYRMVILSKDHRGHSFRVHTLVLEAFVGPRPDGMEGCHGPGGHLDNRVENLRWDTHAANIRDTLRDGTHPNARKTHCPYGHEYTPENTYVSKNGRGRDCKKCIAGPPRGRTWNGLSTAEWGNHNRSKTHCKWGHEFTPENTKVRGRGRICLACQERRNRARFDPSLRIHAEAVHA
jgi:hypothetical protein